MAHRLCRLPKSTGAGLAASLRKGVFAEGLPRLEGHGVVVLERAVSAAQAIVLEAAGERRLSWRGRALPRPRRAEEVDAG
jgi:hypothetical protein